MRTGCEGHSTDTGCASIPALTRPTYHFGQMLGQPEFRDEHEYFANKLRLLARYGIGHGVRCGLEVAVTAERTKDCDLHGQQVVVWWLTIDPGIAIDRSGQLIVVRRPVRCRFADLLPATCLSDYHAHVWWVSICFAECPVCPSRPLAMDSCDPCAPTPYSRLRDQFVVRIDDAPPEHVCDRCCGTPPECVVLARVGPAADCSPEHIGGPEATSEVPVADLRPPLGIQLTTVCAVNWVHDADYETNSLRHALADPRRGLMIRFSAPILLSTLRASSSGRPTGVVEVEVLEGGAPPRTRTYYPEFSVEPVDGDGETAEVIRLVLSADRNGPQVTNDDRWSVRLHCDHILDHCGRAVDGNHIGGAVRTRQLGEVPFVEPTSSPPEPSWWDEPPAGSHRAAHQLGNGTEGGTFTSWFFAVDERVPYASDEQHEEASS